jgi:hypothetical protein
VEKFRSSEGEGYELEASEVEKLLADCWLAPIDDKGPLLLIGERGLEAGRSEPILTVRVDDSPAARVDDSSAARVDDSSTARVDDSSTVRVDDSSTVRVDDSSTVRVDESSTARVDDSSTESSPLNNELNEQANWDAQADPADVTEAETGSGASGSASQAGPPPTRRKGRSKGQGDRTVHQRLKQRQKPRASDHPILTMPWVKYLSMAQWMAEQLTAEHPMPPPADMAAVLRGLGIDPDQWPTAVDRFDKWFHHVAGGVSKLAPILERTGRRWVHGVSRCRQVFAAVFT